MVKCNNCKNLETKDNGFDSYSWCEKINDCPHEDIERDCDNYAPMTNADRIRSMTENEAIEELKYDCNEIGKAIPCDTSWGESFENAYAMAIKALEEVQQYRQIGTVEECRAWKEKQNAKKIISFDYNNGTVNYGCPVCKRKIISKIDGEWCGGTFNEYCDRCGQKLDWRVNDENTD